MPRNAEVIRQWTVLREIERARTGLTIDDLAAQCGVTTRTIRRDLQALEEAGFPLYDDRSHDDGRTRWRLRGQAFSGLAAGLTLSEWCALYFSRTLLEALASAPFREDAERAFDKLAASLPAHVRHFLDRLPKVLASKRDPMRKRPHPAQALVAGRLLDGVLHLRQASLTYHSQASERTKTYLVHPYQLAHAHGGLYLLALVPEYGQVRTFALERIQAVSLLEEHFTPEGPIPPEAFPHSLGVHSGPPSRVEIVFAPAVADYVGAYDWHASQRLTRTSEGGVRVTLDVCVDRALTSWILSFGSSARVVAPETLAREIAEQLEQAGHQYQHIARARSAAHSRK